MRGFARLGRVAGATVYAHWSVIVITAILVAIALQHALSTLFLVGCYLGLLVVHESGHAFAARRLGYGVWSIELYPLHGVTRCDAPRNPYDGCVIAWGGVLAQLAVALPLLCSVWLFGFTRFGLANAVIGIFGHFSLVLVVYNLMPVLHFDGVRAWPIVPLLWRRWRRQRASPGPRERSESSSVRKGPWLQ